MIAIIISCEKNGKSYTKICHELFNRMVLCIEIFFTFIIREKELWKPCILLGDPYFKIEGFTIWRKNRSTHN